MPSFSMNTSTNKTTPAEASASPNFVLSLLAACSTAVPSAGLQGEATLSEQLSALLQDKAMAEDELRMLYSYRFGFSINDALKFTGFQGQLQDFLGQEKRFCVRDGSISLTTVVVATKHEAPLAVDEFLAKSADDDDDSVSNAETESTNAAESGFLDSDSDEVDITGWHSVGNRLIATLDSLDCSNAQDSDVVDVVGWKVLGGRVAAAFRDDDDAGGADAVAWHDVGSRIALACKRNGDDERLQDVSPDATEWMSVGTRVYRCLDSLEVATEEL